MLIENDIAMLVDVNNVKKRRLLLVEMNIQARVMSRYILPEIVPKGIEIEVDMIFRKWCRKHAP